MLGDDHLGAALVELGHKRVAVEGRVGDQPTKGNVFDEWCDPDAVVTVARQQLEAQQIAKGVREGEDLGGQAALGAADGLALSPPFAPCPWR
jgi:hypothetical protein